MNFALFLEWLTSYLPKPRVIKDRAGERPYLTRWYLWGRPTMPPGPFYEPFDAMGNPFPEAVWPKGFSVYLHKIHKSDDEQELHNHPWSWARAFILAGGYLEERRVSLWKDEEPTSHVDAVRGYRRRPGDVVTLDADTYHRVVLSPCEACRGSGRVEKTVGWRKDEYGGWVETCRACGGSKCEPSWSLFVAGPKHGASWRFWNRVTGESWPWREFLAMRCVHEGPRSR